MMRSNIHSNVAEDIEKCQNMCVELNENVIVTSEDLVLFWRFFRLSDAKCLDNFGPLLHNSGKSHAAPKEENLSCDPNYTVVARWFSKYIDMCINSGSTCILRIETPHGGIYIRTIAPDEARYGHKFVTADLPSDETLTVSLATFIVVA